MPTPDNDRSPACIDIIGQRPGRTLPELRENIGGILKQIPITCKGSTTRSIDDLLDFQGNLKTLDPAQAAQARQSIIKHGFTFPVFVWGNKVIDGHQRLFVVRQMLKEGYTIGPIPVDEIEARDEKEAAEKLLALNSRYGQITQDGFMEFIGRFDLDLGDMPEIHLPELDLSALFGEDGVEEVDAPELKDGDRAPFRQMTFTVHDEHFEEVEAAIAKAKHEGGDQSSVNENSNGNALAWICQRFNRG